MIQVLNSFNSFFVQFFGILSYKAKIKKYFIMFKSFAKSLEDKIL